MQHKTCQCGQEIQVKQVLTWTHPIRQLFEKV
jgi:hypothetical protein